MKFTDLKVDGFGVWSGIEVGELSPGLNVFYGPNEAGKTTLMQFARAALYGISSERRARYLPPVRGGRGGGSLGVLSPQGQFRISRVEREHLPLGEATVVAADGTIQGEPQLRELLGDIDESIFNNVFAVGLGEMQELGTLDGTAAARLLYDLSTGLDCVSLAQVLHELEASRNRLVSPDEKPSVIGILLAKREQLRAELDELSKLTARRWQIAADRERLAEQIARAEAEMAGVERESRIVELAAALEPKWQARAALDEQLASLGPPSHLPANALLRMDRYRERIRSSRRRLKKIAIKRKTQTAELAAIKINEPLWKQAPRILALAEHESWIAAAEQQLREAEADVAKIEHASGIVGKPTTAKPAQASSASTTANVANEKLAAAISPSAIAALRGPAADLRRKSRVARAAKQSIGQFQEQAANHTQTVEKSLLEAGETDLPGALEKAGNLASQLRRRVQLDERLDRMSRHRADLEEQSHELLERQILPGWILASLGGIFMLGVLLLLAGMFLPTKIIGSFGGTLAVLGILAFGTAVAAKWFLEKAAARQLESCRKQLTMLEAQTKQAQQERDSLDEQLPKGGGNLTARLQAAEANLAKLEALTPLDAKRAAAGQDKEAAEKQAAVARDELKAAHRRWQAALAATGLPKNTSPKQIGQLVRESAAAHETHGKLREARDERDRRKRELAAFSARIEPLALDAQVLPDSSSPSEQLRELKKQVADQESLVVRRDVIRKRLRRLRASKAKYSRMLRRYKRRRLALLRSAGVSNESEFARRAAERGQVDQLHRRRELLDRELKEAVAGICSEADMAALVGPVARDHFSARRVHAAERLHAVRAAMNRLFEQRGQFNEQLRALADDRGIARKRLELGVIEEQLKQAIQRWQVLAATRMILDSIKQDYERNRQPETLREASGYLARMTEGRYQRVWTPLGEEALRVDAAAGQSLSIEVLSRGTREQLFLSLRLALVGLYAQRGQSMPLVLDDVLVNFDEDRARAAAAVLQDFAAAGHQLFVFTCHEHLAAMFKSLGVGVRRLPSNSEVGSGVAPLQEMALAVAEPAPAPPEQPKRRRSKPKPEPQPVAKPQADEDAAFELAPLDDLPMPPPIAAEILQPELIRAEPIVTAREHRADPPHKRVILRRYRRGWSAEEFEGELEDRVANAFAFDERRSDDDLNGDTSDI